MAKDPAFLFYPGDVLQEISLMNNLQRGIYLSLICYLHKNICISHEQLMSFTAGTNEQDIKVIIASLTKDTEGNYYIEWLKKETERRKEYSLSRSKNRSGTGKKKKKSSSKKDEKTYVPHMETETVTKTEDENKTELGGVGVKEKTLHVRMREMFCEEYKRSTGITYDYNGIDGKKINELEKSIRGTIRDKIDGYNDEDVYETFKILIQNLPKWYKDNAFDLKTIAGNYSKIIAQLNIKSNANKIASVNAEVDEYIRRHGNPYAREGT